MAKQAIAVRPAWAKALDEREFAFTASYIEHFNAARAARAAGSAAKASNVMGHRWRNLPHIREAIDKALAEKMPAVKLSIIEKLGAILMADPADYAQVATRFRYTGEGKARRRLTYQQVEVTATKKLTPQQRLAVKGVKQRTSLYGSTIEVQLHCPIAAATKLADILGMNQGDKGPVGGGVTFVIETPDGTTMTMQTGGASATSEIDHAAIDAEIEKNIEVEEELPPGASRLEIETP